MIRDPGQLVLYIRWSRVIPVPTFIDPTPSSHVRRLADKISGIVWNAYRENIRLESDGFVEAQHGQIVFKGPGVELRVRGDQLDAVLLVTVRLGICGQVVLSQAEHQVSRRYTANKKSSHQNRFYLDLT